MVPPDTNGADQVVAEHVIQLRLLDAVHDAVESESAADELGSIFEQLLDYSRIHFLSEELLMRLHAFEGYRDHLQDHEQMLDEMEVLHTHHGDGTRPLTWDVVEHLRARLLRHITGRDRELHEHIATSETARA